MANPNTRVSVCCRMKVFVGILLWFGLEIPHRTEILESPGKGFFALSHISSLQLQQSGVVTFGCILEVSS